MIEFKDDDSYGVVTDSQGDSDYDFFYVTVNSKGRIQEDQRADYEDIYRVYTRYPTDTRTTDLTSQARGSKAARLFHLLPVHLHAPSQGVPPHGPIGRASLGPACMGAGNKYTHMVRMP